MGGVRACTCVRCKRGRKCNLVHLCGGLFTCAGVAAFPCRLHAVEMCRIKAAGGGGGGGGGEHSSSASRHLRDTAQWPPEQQPAEPKKACPVAH